jgi:hypothetical protein
MDPCGDTGLGCDAGAVLPPLLALRSVTVRLPEYLVRALERVAVENKTTMESALHGELIDFAGALSGRMEAHVPGFRRAYFLSRSGVDFDHEAEGTQTAAHPA